MPQTLAKQDYYAAAASGSYAAALTVHISSDSRSLAVQTYDVIPAAIAGVLPSSERCFRQKL